MAAPFGFFSFGSRVQHLQFIRNESERRNTGATSGKGGIFQLLRVNAKSSRYTMDILASMKCISVSRLLGFALISLPRKFIICLSVPDSCTVVFKGINYDFLFLSSLIQSRTPANLGRALLIDRQAPYTSQTMPPKLFFLIFEAYKIHTHTMFLCFQYEINCIKSLKSTWGHLKICFSVL